MQKVECSSKYHLGKPALRKSLKRTILVERQMATRILKGFCWHLCTVERFSSRWRTPRVRNEKREQHRGTEHGQILLTKILPWKWYQIHQKKLSVWTACHFPWTLTSYMQLSRGIRMLLAVNAGVMQNMCGLQTRKEFPHFHICFSLRI